MQVFISYSRHDRDFALRLCEQIRHWGHTTWLDIQNIPKGAPWPDEIDKGLETSDVVVGVLSENSMMSGNVKNEWDWALEYDRPLIPVRLRPCQVSHRYVRLDYIDCAENEVGGLAQLREVLTAPQTSYRDNVLSEESTPPKPQEKHIHEPRNVDNRARMLQKVYDFWIKGVLEPSKLGDVWLDLAAGQRPEAVQPEIRRDVRNPDFDTFTLGTGKSIADVFHHLGRELLILGAPGSGKTITLLELAKDLLVQAQTDKSFPIPMLLNLASWAEQHPDKLDNWIVERLFIEYGVPRKLAISWIDNGRLLYLLDGLDEVPLDYRDACVKAINAFWQRYDQVDNGIVVCSRIADYDILTEQLHLENAIQLQALTQAQADVYLTQLGPSWNDLRAALPADPVLCEFAQSPLLLNIMAVAYQNVPREQIMGFENEAVQKKHLFDHYVASRLRGDSAQPKYSHTQTRHYLAWLAQKMIAHEQIVFQIECLQSNWLNTERQQQIYSRNLNWTTGTLGGLVIGLFVSLVGGLIFGTGVGLFFGLFVGLMAVILFRLSSIKAASHTIIATDKLSWSWTQARHWLGVGLVRGLFLGLLVGLVIGVFLGLITKLIIGVFFGLSLGIAFGLVFGLGVGLIFGLVADRIELHTAPNQGIRRSLINGLVVGVGFGLFIGLAFGLVFGLFFGLEIGLFFALFLGPFLGLAIGTRYGGRAALQHAILRWMLYHSGIAPKNYAKFLLYTSSRHLTRQVGGGFIFRHRMLMEHFAQQEN